VSDTSDPDADTDKLRIMSDRVNVLLRIFCSGGAMS
jgi:hypothetical protein